MDDPDGFSTLMHANLIEIFGQRDRTRRREAMRRAYAENIAFTDPEGTVHGYDAVDERVRKVLDKTPETFIFAPDGPLYVLSGAAAALPWKFGPPSEPPAARGIDIAAIADGRITSLQTLLTDEQLFLSERTVVRAQGRFLRIRAGEEPALGAVSEASRPRTL
jgi:hypothetical protein